MRFIPRTLHGALDYTVGIFIALSPWLLGLPRGISSTIPVIMGLGALLYSALTNYELGLIRVIPFQVHLGLDIASALIFIIAPYALHMTGNVTAPYVSFGLFELFAAVLTNPHVQGPLPPRSSW